MPSPCEAPSGGAKPFGSFLAFEKGTRRKGETIGGRYRSNGYAHHPKNPSRQTQSLRDQARSHEEPKTHPCLVSTDDEATRTALHNAHHETLSANEDPGMIDIRGLSYFVSQIENLSHWQRYAEDVLGMQVNPAPGGGLYVKMDERPFRMLIVEGAEARYLASGWELANETAFKAALEHLSAAGIEWQPGSAAEIEQRGVQALVKLTDPSGNCHELSWGHRSDCLPFVSPQGVPRFITGDMGLGHTVLPAPNFDATLAFAKDVLGFELSDIFNFRPDPSVAPIRIHFLHCQNARHHSLALAEYPVPSGCVHVMVEVDSMTEVGRAHDRLRAHEVALSATLGQHLNDRMTSFYMKTPSGFDLEYGFGGLQVDWAEHSAFEFTRVSIWGHDFSVGQR
jgi:3,4-dihydroxy-9,10-secoandrosta-1,3,5(10)-triene-9,17-dione 4,5-dioxygenase